MEYKPQEFSRAFRINGLLKDDHIIYRVGGDTSTTHIIALTGHYAQAGYFMSRYHLGVS